MRKQYTILMLAALVLLACGDKQKQLVELEIEVETKIAIQTTAGNIVLKLYNETPLHRDNILKLVKGKRYDSLLFHRVIKNFMIQAGDPESKNAASDVMLGDGDLPYTIPAEFNSKAFHKRGALGAARNGNIARASSAMQFYIVQGRVYTDSTLQKAEGRINNWLAENAVVNATDQEWVKIWAAFASEKRKISSDSITLLKSRIDSLAGIYLETASMYRIPDIQREVYKNEGGAAHLDQNYTVFGEVISGMAVIDKIADAQTNASDRPVKDIRILGAEVIK